MPKSRGADAFVASLAAAGIRRIFTLSGNHVMPIFDAAIDVNLQLIHVRHEAAAVHMADAWARLTGEVGIALVTGGPGHANAVGALYTAAMAESPIVLFSGHAPHDELGKGAFQEMRQEDIAAPLCKASWTCASAEVLSNDVARALALARGGRSGPVHVSLPTDTLEGHARAGAYPATEAERDPVSFDAAPFLSQLRSSRRPLILAGPAACTKRGRAQMASLEDSTGVPVVCMESPRGVADPSLGAFAQALSQADCILLLGKRLDFTLKFGRAPAIAGDCAFAQVDPEDGEIARTRRAMGERLEHAAIANLFDAAEAIAKQATTVRSAWRDEVRSAIDFRPAAWDSASSSISGKLHPVQALRPMQALLDAHPDSVFISDGGEFGQWAQACLRAPNRVINGVAGAIGPALPFALAARISKPNAPVIAAMGDGTFGFHASEIDTAARYVLPFLAVVGNDARWNAEHQIQIREYGAARALGTDLSPARYDEVARGFGGYGELVAKPAELIDASKRAMASGLPAVLNVMIEGLAAPNIRR